MGQRIQGMMVRFDSGDLGGLANLEESMRIYREIGDQRGMRTVANNLGLVLYAMGDLDGARAEHEESMRIARVIANERYVAYGLENVAEILHDQGDLKGAKRLLDDALARFSALHEQIRIATILENLGKLDVSRGESAAAERNFRRALGIAEDGRQHRVARSCQIDLAKLAIDRGALAEAKELANTAVKGYERDHDWKSEAEALGVLSRALALGGQAEEAQHALDQALALAARRGAMEPRLATTIQVGEAQLALGQRRQATALLEGAAKMAEQHRFVRLSLAAQLAWAHVETSAKDLVKARTRLTALARRAEGLGFTGISERAAKDRRALGKLAAKK